MTDQPDAAALASRIAARALRDAAGRAVDAAVKRHMGALAATVAARPSFHVVDVAEHGWTLMHPLIGCGQDLFGCLVNEAAERGFARPDRYGRYRCDVDGNGRLVVGGQVRRG
jgi:hypothetical protein